MNGNVSSTPIANTKDATLNGHHHTAERPMPMTMVVAAPASTDPGMHSASSSLLHLADHARRVARTPSLSPRCSGCRESEIVHRPDGDREDVEGVFERWSHLGARFEIRIVKVRAKTTLAQLRALMPGFQVAISLFVVFSSVALLAMAGSITCSRVVPSRSSSCNGALPPFAVQQVSSLYLSFASTPPFCCVLLSTCHQPILFVCSPAQYVPLFCLLDLLTHMVAHLTLVVLGLNWRRQRSLRKLPISTFLLRSLCCCCPPRVDTICILSTYLSRSTR